MYVSMLRVLSVATIIIFWILLAIGLLIITLFTIPKFSANKAFSLFISGSSRNLYEEEVVDGTNSDTKVLSNVTAGDSRVVLVERFLAKYASPMVGSGKTFVAAADQYRLDWRLLPAIAFQESNLGKRIPKGSHNPFGWAIFTGENSGIYFDSWEAAIETVAKGLRNDYLNYGLTEPETIAVKYTEKANPSWVFAVKTAMEEIAGDLN